MQTAGSQISVLLFISVLLQSLFSKCFSWFFLCRETRTKHNGNAMWLWHFRCGISVVVVFRCKPDIYVMVGVNRSHLMVLAASTDRWCLWWKCWQPVLLGSSAGLYAWNRWNGNRQVHIPACVWVSLSVWQSCCWHLSSGLLGKDKARTPFSLLPHTW